MWMSLSVIVAVLVVLQLCTASADLPIKPFIVGHRGEPSVAPENTMESFWTAFEHGAQGIETDLRLTKDGVMICMHDEDLSRTTNCTGRVDEMTWDEIKGCDASNNMTAFKGLTPVPLFEEVLSFAKLNEIFIVMDLKVANGSDPLNDTIPYGPVLAPLVSKYNMSSMVIASCWYPWQITDMRTNLPGVPRQWLSGGLGYSNPNFWAEAVAAGINGFSLTYTNMTAAFVEMAKQQFLGVAAWTVNDEKTMRAVLSYGVSAILTDYTPLLVDVIDDYYAPDCSGVETYKTQLYATAAVAGGLLVVVLVLVYLLVRMNNRFKYAEIQPGFK